MLSATCLEKYRRVRQQTEELCQPLAIDDYQLQTMPDCSPPKWHLAHTTWFFETFLLAGNNPSYRPFHPRYNFLFNSYYEAVGERWPRPARGLLSRPTVEEVFAYRRAIDERMHEWLDPLSESSLESIRPVFELGLNHEQQHQELLLTDIKHAFSINPLRPVFSNSETGECSTDQRLHWLTFPAGVRQIGHIGASFAFDNESPAHSVYVPPFQISSNLVTNREFLAFIDDGGYRRPEFWLSDGWATCRRLDWSSPLYWEHDGGSWLQFTLGGMRSLSLDEPVCHVSFYEAEAFARWTGARLPTEAEWETAALDEKVTGIFLDSGRLHPAQSGGFFGNLWVWTASPYVAYPGYHPAAGALGEYNGKFMCNQMVLRGGSCATPADHIRPTYRNFFPPDARWQFSGIRLARDIA